MGMHCRNCHYALEGLTGPPHRCPECGAEFDHEGLNNFDRVATRPRRVLKATISGAIVMFISVAVLLTVIGQTNVLAPLLLGPIVIFLIALGCAILVMPFLALMLSSRDPKSDNMTG